MQAKSAQVSVLHHKLAELLTEIGNASSTTALHTPQLHRKSVQDSTHKQLLAGKLALP